VAVTVRGEEQACADAIERRVEVTLSNGRVVTFAGRGTRLAARKLRLSDEQRRRLDEAT
jgi:hypothetical protein